MPAPFGAPARFGGSALPPGSAATAREGSAYTIHPGDQGSGGDAADEAPVVRLVNSLIAQAVTDGASDVHFEPKVGTLLVRFRIDGVLHPVTALPRQFVNGVVSRLKIMADLDIAERRLPQDGRTTVTTAGKRIDLRVASLPTVHGEKIVVRLLDKDTVTLALEELGFCPDALAVFRGVFQRPHGAVLVTGPTGSGKSTTLYAALNILDSDERNILTVEDPVEYQLSGINQVPVNRRAGMTFAAALRAILRCDPDIIMVGEIRDAETARIAVQSALTGHLVLSTLHTNDAAGAISRLTEMGVEPFLIASALTCVVSQRLARRLCPACREPYEPAPEEARAAGLPADHAGPGLVLHRARGCPQCRQTGYRGRVGIYEVLPMSAALRALTVSRSSAAEIAGAARREGMKTLHADGLAKALSGLTSLEEIARVVA